MLRVFFSQINVVKTMKKCIGNRFAHCLKIKVFKYTEYWQLSNGSLQARCFFGKFWITLLSTAVLLSLQILVLAQCHSAFFGAHFTKWLIFELKQFKGIWISRNKKPIFYRWFPIRLSRLNEKALNYLLIHERFFFVSFYLFRVQPIDELE